MMAPIFDPIARIAVGRGYLNAAVRGGHIGTPVALLLLSVAFASAAIAKEELTPEATLRSFDRYNSRGLAQSTVTAFAQDTEGVLWLGTFDGLARFEGTEIVRV